MLMDATTKPLYFTDIYPELWYWFGSFNIKKTLYPADIIVKRPGETIMQQKQAVKKFRKEKKTLNWWDAV